MSTEIKLTQNPIIAQSEVKVEAQAVDPALEKAKTVYSGLQEDIQKMLVEDYIKPQLEEGDKLISLFNELIESEECMLLKYQCLIDPVTKIIQNETALAKMRKIDTVGFNRIYEQHFIKKENTFTLVSDPYMSMCMEFVMRRWH